MTAAKTAAMPAPTMAMALPAAIDNISKNRWKTKRTKPKQMLEAAQQQQQCQQEQQWQQQNNKSPGSKQEDPEKCPLSN